MPDGLSSWLALREQADWAARSERLVRQVCARLRSEAPTRVLDLGSGSGSNVRYLIDRLPGHQRWLVVDQDPRLLTEQAARATAWAAAHRCEVATDARGYHLRHAQLDCDVETRRMNLDSLDGIPFDGQQLVTASALLDLVSERWLRLLAQHCGAVGAVVLFTITYDGRSFCDPVEPEDALVRDLMNQHQRRDKGLGGPAAGPGGHAAAMRIFAEAGYHVESEPSDWILTPDDRALQDQLMEGWAEAAREVAPECTAQLADWLARRRAHLAAGRSRVRVGHHDLAGWLHDGGPV
jgi:SAM-dependent methyltransferase